MPSTHQNRVVVTGGNRGLGLGFVRQFLARGDRVVATARDPDRAAELRDLGREVQDRLHVVRLDVADDRSVAGLRDGLPFAAIDLLVNNAGVGGGQEETILEIDGDSMVETFRVNSVGPLLVTRALWSHLAEGAKVVYVSSLMGSVADNGSGGRYAYRMSKSALNMAVRCLGYECAERGITTFAIHPGWVRTAMGGDGAPLAIEESVAAMIRTLARIGANGNGGFFDRDGQPLPW